MKNETSRYSLPHKVSKIISKNESKTKKKRKFAQKIKSVQNEQDFILNFQLICME